jgi:hypothetical protein
MSLKLPSTEGTEVMILSGLRLLAAARAVSEAAEVAVAFGPVHAELEAAMEDYRTCKREYEPSRVRVTLADVRADEATRRLAAAVRTLDGGTCGAVYDFLFPAGPGFLVRLVGQAQVEAMDVVLSRYEELSHRQDLSALNDAFARFCDSHAEYIAALADRDTLTTRLCAARDRLERARDIFRDAFAHAQSVVTEMFIMNRRMQSVFFRSFDEPEASDDKAVAEGQGE